VISPSIGLVVSITPKRPKRVVSAMSMVSCKRLTDLLKLNIRYRPRYLGTAQVS
jgi:hypothetical protein